MAKYDSLRDHLKNSATGPVTLSFARIDELVGKDDVQTIPLKSVSGVHPDRKTLGTDQVRLDVGSVSYEWKVSQAEAMVAELHQKMYGV